MQKTVEVPYDKKLAETERSVLYVIDGEKVWVPKSAIEDDSHGKLTLEEWIAIDRKLV